MRFEAHELPRLLQRDVPALGHVRVAGNVDLLTIAANWMSNKILGFIRGSDTCLTPNHTYARLPRTTSAARFRGATGVATASAYASSVT